MSTQYCLLTTCISIVAEMKDDQFPCLRRIGVSMDTVDSGALSLE